MRKLNRMTFADAFWALIDCAIGALIWFALGLPARGGELVGNVAPYDDWSTGRPFVNVALLLRPWGSAGTQWDSSYPLASYSADGYPTSDAGGFFSGRDYAPGRYSVSFDGSAQLTFTGADSSINPKSINVGSDGFYFTIRNPVGLKNLRIVRDGYDPAATFTPEYLSQFAPFATLRAMDVMRTNTVASGDWTKRTLPGQLQTSEAKGAAWEYVIDLCNATGKNLWLCVPDIADDNYVAKLAQLCATRLKPGLVVYVEISNEVWNAQFSQYSRMLAASATDPNLNLHTAYELVALKLRKAVLAFRGAFGGNDRVRGVLMGQAGNTWFVDVGLNYLDQKYGAGTARDVVYAVGYADYFAPAYDDEIRANVSVDDLFASMTRAIATDSVKWYKDCRAVANKYGVRAVITYEGGQNVRDIIYDPRTWAATKANHDLHLRMQTDPRMKDAYLKAGGQFFAAGGDAWGHYTGVADWGDGSWGYWGVNRTSTDVTPKWLALCQLAGIPPPPTSQPTSQPSTMPTTTRPVASVTVTIPNVGTLKFNATSGETIDVEYK